MENDAIKKEILKILEYSEAKGGVSNFTDKDWEAVVEMANQISANNKEAREECIDVLEILDDENRIRRGVSKKNAQSLLNEPQTKWLNVRLAEIEKQIFMKGGVSNLSDDDWDGLVKCLDHIVEISKNNEGVRTLLLDYVTCLEKKKQIFKMAQKSA